MEITMEKCKLYDSGWRPDFSFALHRQDQPVRLTVYHCNMHISLCVSVALAQTTDHRLFDVMLDSA